MIFLDNLYSVVSAHAEGDTAFRYTIDLIPDSVIFSAHFPGEPIMPGACIVQMVEELYDLWTQRSTTLLKVNNLKFLAVISPTAVSSLDVCLEVKAEDASATHIKADIIAGDVVYARMSLILAPKP